MKITLLPVYFTVLVISLVLINCVPVYAQPLSNSEIGKWDKVAQFYLEHPNALKDLTERFNALKQSSNLTESELEKLQSSLDSKNIQILKLYSENLKLKSKLETVPTQNGETAKKVKLPTNDHKVRFKVQIGAFEKSKALPELPKTKSLVIEETKGYWKVLIGDFRSYKAAKQLRSQLKTSGIKDAWIVTYKDGQRISLNELEELPPTQPDERKAISKVYEEAIDIKSSIQGTL